MIPSLIDEALGFETVEKVKIPGPVLAKAAGRLRVSNGPFEALESPLMVIFGPEDVSQAPFQRPEQVMTDHVRRQCQEPPHVAFRFEDSPYLKSDSTVITSAIYGHPLKIIMVP